MLTLFLFSCAEDKYEEQIPEAEVLTLPYYHTPDFQPIWESDQKDTSSLKSLSKIPFISPIFSSLIVVVFARK